MNKTRKAVLSVGLIIIMVVLVIWLSTPDRSSTGKTIKIGAVIPLSGTQAHVGEGLRNALVLAQRNLGKTKYTYEVIVEDGQFDVKTSIGAAQKLINVDKVDVILDAYAPIGNAISPITEKSEVVHIGIAFDPKIAEGKYNFLLFTTPETAARTFLAEMQKRSMGTLGIFKVNNQGILAVHDAIKMLSKEYGVTIATDETFQPGERDFRDLIARSSVKKPDLYALLALPPELEILAKQLFDQNIRNISSTIYFELSPNKGLFEGLWSVGYSSVSTLLDNEYKTSYGKGMTFGVPNIYDSFNVIVRAAETYDGQDKPNAEYIASHIHVLADFDGSLGKLHVNDAGIIDSPASIKIVKNGQLVPF